MRLKISSNGLYLCRRHFDSCGEITILGIFGIKVRAKICWKNIKNMIFVKILRIFRSKSDGPSIFKQGEEGTVSNFAPLKIFSPRNKFLFWEVK